VDIKLKESLKIVGYYTFFGIWWILFSDRILSVLVEDIKVYKVIQVYKGTFFIFLTAFLLFRLIINSYSKVETLDKRLQNTLIELQEKQAELEKLAYVDFLTGLATRRLLDEKYELLFESAKRSKTSLALVMMDIDYFKKYNDKYGHPEGDIVLKEIGILLKKVFRRDGDVVSRYGGEEFLVVLYQTSLKDVISLVDDFQSRLKTLNIEHLDAPLKRITISMGINSSTITRDQTSDIFLKEVDKELYKAKIDGKNRYSIKSV